MFRRLILLVVYFSFTSSISFNVMACNWDLHPDVLLVTSYSFAQNQPSQDQLVYKKLQEVYSTRAVSATFSYKDDDGYTTILRNLINTFSLKKIFILDSAFTNYLPKHSGTAHNSTSLIKMLQQFTDVQFYFFNNQIANNIKVTNNIFEFRFDTPNQDNPQPKSYGEQLANHFYNSLLDTTGKVDPNKYNFDTDNNGNWVIKIGVINNIGSSYQQSVINEFIKNLKEQENTPPATVYEIYSINIPNSTISYNDKNVSLVLQAAINLYTSNHVNFIINTNGWYNNAIAVAASYTSSFPQYTKTIKFIASDINNPSTYIYNNNDYLLFSYNIDLSFLDYTSALPDKLKVLNSSSEAKNAYGINSDLIFIDGA